jgi:hypothetical protein
MRRGLPHLTRPGEAALPPAVQLHIGEYRISRTPEVLYTLLGSCVAVCLYDASACIGGMNHILLPGRAEEEGRFDDVARFGLDAVGCSCALSAPGGPQAHGSPSSSEAGTSSGGWTNSAPPASATCVSSAS